MAALNFKKLIGDNLPAILTGLGVAGAATSVVLAVSTMSRLVHLVQQESLFQQR